jgi:hypothetical protein
MQSVLIITNVTSSNTAPGEVYSIQHYVIKFVSDLRQVGGVLRVFRFPPPIKLTAKILLKVALNTITLYINMETLENLLKRNSVCATEHQNHIIFFS